jgi:hypothetical protein
MSPLPPPPVPQGLRGLLKDYPAHIQILQEDLNKVVAKRSPGIDPFDRAIWMLESALGAFIQEARKELKTAEASGDAEAIARAEKKELLMLHAGSVSQYDLSELRIYLKAYQEQIL